VPYVNKNSAKLETSSRQDCPSPVLLGRQRSTTASALLITVIKSDFNLNRNYCCCVSVLAFSYKLSVSMIPAGGRLRHNTSLFPPQEEANQLSAFYTSRRSIEWSIWWY